MAACRRQPRFKAVQAGGQQAVEAVAVPSVPSAMASGEARAPSSDRALHSFDSRLVLSGVGGVGREACRACRGFEAGNSSDQLFPVRLAAGQRD